MKQVETRMFAGMARKAALVTPPVAIVAWLIRGPKAGITVLVAVALVLAVFAITAFPASIAAQISPGALGGVFLFGFVIKLGAMTAIVAYLRHRSYIDFPVFFGAFAISYLALLSAETVAWVNRRPEIAGETGGPGPEDRAPSEIGEMVGSKVH